MIRFLTSSHCGTYIRLALKHFCTPEHVYNIAHGQEATRGRDRKIVHELFRLGIVHRHHHSHRASDYEM
jgi:hypothetical protein